MEKCNFSQMSWKCPVILFWSSKNVQGDQHVNDFKYWGERTQDNPKI